MNVKECPFCAAPDPRRYVELRRGQLFVVLQCRECCIGTSMSVNGTGSFPHASYESIEAGFADLYERWNKRTPPMPKRKGKR